MTEANSRLAAADSSADAGSAAVRILVLDDEESIRWVIQKTFAGTDYRLHFADSAEAATALVERQAVDFALVDINLPGDDGLAFLRQQQARNPGLLVAIITGQGGMSHAIDAMKLGAFDFLTKPFDLAEIEGLFARAAHAVRLGRKHPGSMGGSPPPREEGENLSIVGRSRSMREVFKSIGRVAATDFTVLVLGESGTGKELIARAIHTHSARSQSPFMAVNCAAIPRDLLEAELFGYEKGAFTGAAERKAGRLEAAQDGTVFLDEIGDMSLDLQAKLLRVLQEREFQRVGGLETRKLRARVVTATNQSLEDAVGEGRFRADLYYRINTVTIQVDPLRERREDIPQLVEHFLHVGAARLGMSQRAITPEAVACLADYDWPGNVRELENVIKSLLIMARGGVIDAGDLPRSMAAEQPDSGVGRSFEQAVLRFWQPVVSEICNTGGTGLLERAQSHLERPLIQDVLRHTGWNQLKAAAVLGINRNTLRSKLQALGIRKEDRNNG